MLKCVKCCLKIKNDCLKTQTKHSLKGTSDFGIIYKSGVSCKVVGFREDDYARDIAIRKFTTRYVFGLGSKAISWCSKQQPTVSL